MSRAERKARQQSATDKIFGVGPACGICGSGEHHSGETMYVARELFGLARESFYLRNNGYHPERWPSDQWPVCDPCIGEGFTIDPVEHIPGVQRGEYRAPIAGLYAAVKLLGVELDRVLADTINGREAHRFIENSGRAPVYDGPLYYYETRAQPGLRTHVRARWEHAGGLQEAYDRALRASKVTVHSYDAGCDICRRTHQELKAGSWHRVHGSIAAERARELMLCEVCFRAHSDAVAAGMYAALDIAVSDAAGVPTYQGIAKHHGIDPPRLPAARGPWEAVDLNVLFSAWQSDRTKAAATGVIAVRAS